MKIGILTFHWATNYGAVLQAYCLQSYLMGCGHSAEIINYKPSEYEISWNNYLKHPTNWLHIKKYLPLAQKEKYLQEFRNKYLNQTSLVRAEKEIEKVCYDYSIVISGSDQVLNPSFTMYGENQAPSSAYYLNHFDKNVKKIGYAVSFGCINYPKYAFDNAEKWIQNFDAISVREITGLEILQQLSYKKNQNLVPDPTILYGNKLFHDLGVIDYQKKEDYTCVYMLRREISIKGNIRYIDDTRHPLSLIDWLKTISHASLVVTNSYHGMLMAILSHTSFYVLLEEGNASGMNDRFYTVLDRLGLEDRIIDGPSLKIHKAAIDWDSIDVKLLNYKKEGITFLNSVLYENTSC